MLDIRPEQIDALAAVKLSNFKARMAAHFKKHDPEWCAAQGAQGLVSFIGHGIGRAKAHGFLAEVEVARYLHVMRRLGKDFDESPSFPWAKKLLASKLPGPEKMDCLRDAVDYHE